MSTDRPATTDQEPKAYGGVIPTPQTTDHLGRVTDPADQRMREIAAQRVENFVADLTGRAEQEHIRSVMTNAIAEASIRGDGPWATADALVRVLDRAGYTVMSKEDLHDIKHLRRGSCNYCGALIKPEKSGRTAPPGWDGKHWMSCRFYVGPLEHRWVRTELNGTFGGIDHRCVCGGWFRLGGLAGHGDGTGMAEPICPNASETYRGEQ